MDKKTIYFGCYSCNLGVHEYWHEYKEDGKDGQEVTKRRRIRHSQTIECETEQAPMIGEVIDFKDCPQCEEEKTLVRISKS